MPVMLHLKDVNAWYSRAHVLQNVTMAVEQGEIVSLIGRNGAGKTTILRSIMGLVPGTQGAIAFEGCDLMPLPVHRRLPLGLAYVPEERRIVAGLSVRENVRLGLLARTKNREAEMIERLSRVFPRVTDRLNQPAATLSGGEQQMLAMARAYVGEPRMMLLDEPTEGIMPSMVEQMAQLFLHLRDQGVTLVLVEQNVRMALDLSTRAYVIDQGRVVTQGQAGDLKTDGTILRYCGV